MSIESDRASMSSMDTSSGDDFKTVYDDLKKERKENSELKSAIEKQEETIYRQEATIRGLKQGKIVYPNIKWSATLKKDTPSFSGSKFEIVLAKVEEKEAKNLEMKKVFEEQQSTINRHAATILRLYKEKYPEVQDRITTVYEVATDGNIDYDKLNQKILVVNTLERNDDDIWFADGVKISLDGLRVKPWITTHLEIMKPSINMAYILNLVECKNLKDLTLFQQSITFDQYKGLVSTSTVNLTLLMDTVKNDDGSAVGIVELLKEVPNIESFTYDQEITTEDVQKLVQLQPFQHLKDFTLYDLKDNFDLEAFVEFMKKHRAAKYCLDFDHDSSPSLAKKVDEIKEKLDPALLAKCDFVIPKH